MSATVIVTTPEELEALIEKALKKILAPPAVPGTPVTDEEMAEARARWARKMGKK